MSGNRRTPNKLRQLKARISIYPLRYFVAKQTTEASVYYYRLEAIPRSAAKRRKVPRCTFKNNEIGKTVKSLLEESATGAGVAVLGLACRGVELYALCY